MKTFLFAYGTLNPAMAPPHMRGVVGQMRAVGKATARGRLFRVSWFAAAIFEADALTAIHGTVYRLPVRNQKQLLQQLDAYEAVNIQDPSAGLFRRKKVSVVLKNGRTLECWAYEYLGDTRVATWIADGRFSKTRCD